MGRKHRQRQHQVEQVKNALPNEGTPPAAPVTHNDLNSAMAAGFGYFNPFGMPGQGNGIPGTETVSGINTLFKNLRWYLVSNFRQPLSQAYVELGLIQTVVDLPVDDALRGGVKITSSELDEDEIKLLQSDAKQNEDHVILGQAAKWNRLFGGAGVIILTDQDPEEPLDLDTIDENTEVEFRAVDMWELFWSNQNTEGYDPTIQSQDFEHYNYYGEKLHKSRVLPLKGLTAPSFIRPRLRGWGFSVVEILIRSINQYLKATDLTFEVLDEFKLDVYKIKNLVTTLTQPMGEQKVAQRIRMANYNKNYQNAIVMDGEDDYDHKQLSFAGLAEAMTGIRKQVAADMRFPLSKLFGASESTGGLGNSDENDMENYNSMVESQVRLKIEAPMLRMYQIRCQQLFGFVPEDLSIEFNPLRVLTAEQEENVKDKKFVRLEKARSMGEITRFEFREACNAGKLFDIDLDNAGDSLNPDDPDIDETVESGNDVQEGDIDDGEGKEKGTGESAPGKKESTTNARPPALTPSGKMSWHLGYVTPYTVFERGIRKLNSGAFDKASYEADGGQGWVDARRAHFYDTPKDAALWKKAEEAGGAAGDTSWQFRVWWYKKQGGKF